MYNQLSDLQVMAATLRATASGLERRRQALLGNVVAFAVQVRALEGELQGLQTLGLTGAVASMYQRARDVAHDVFIGLECTGCGWEIDSTSPIVNFAADLENATYQSFSSSGPEPEITSLADLFGGLP